MDRLLATGEDRIDSTTKTGIGNGRMVSEFVTLHFMASTIGLDVFSMHKTERGKHPMHCNRVQISGSHLSVLPKLVTVRDIHIGVLHLLLFKKW